MVQGPRPYNGEDIGCPNTLINAPGEGWCMPIADPAKKLLAMKRRLYFKICMRCGAKNSMDATRCRKCRSDDLRVKNRQLGAKK